MPFSPPVLPPGILSTLMKALPKKITVQQALFFIAVLVVLSIMQNGNIAYQGSIDFRYSGTGANAAR